MPPNHDIKDVSLAVSSGDTMMEQKVQMKKILGLREGVAVILGVILGSGIFISPKGVIQEVDSIGFSLVIWMLCGFFALIGALCYAELGTTIPKSGGDYAYINEAFGALPAFLYLWAANLIFVPTTNAIMGITFAKYMIQPFVPNCTIPDGAVTCIAAATICFLSYLNGYNVKGTAKMQNVFMVCKIGALVVVILAGIIWMCLGHTEHFENLFENSTTNPSKIAKAIYSGIFSYSGWNYLNYMTEELKNPFVNLPRAIYISIPLVAGIYILTNVAYLSVLTPEAMIASDAIAMTFGNKLIGKGALVISLMVAVSAFGGLSVHIMATSRMLYVGARNGHFPEILSQLSITKLTPVSSLLFLNTLSLIMLSISDIHRLILYCTVVETWFVMLSVVGLLYMRWTRPVIDRPIKIPIVIPIVFILLCFFLMILPCIEAPVEVGMGLLITVTGIPAYYIGVRWKRKPIFYFKLMRAITNVNQKLFLTTHEE